MGKVNLFWFRRDLRLNDNAGLYHALKSGNPVLPVFIFDTNILDKISDRTDARVSYIHNCIQQIHSELQKYSTTILIRIGDPVKEMSKLVEEFPVETIYTNHDFESYAIIRDANVGRMVSQKGIGFKTFKDHVIFEKCEVVKDDGTPYTVFTPYSKKWKAKLLNKQSENEEQSSFYFKSYPTEKYFHNFLKISPYAFPSLDQIGFQPSKVVIPSIDVPTSLIKNYNEQRDFPGINGTSKLGIHFRFGKISIRAKARKAFILNETYLNELIWRDFYSQILFHFPYVENGPFRKEYSQIKWLNNTEDFEKWCNGRTGYPIVDAGMAELNQTGFMHNRVRMIVASFLTKHLLIDWRWGEHYFAEKLLDFDLASNNGGWQWAAGCGTDAAPYFRIFNPASQTEKFDKNLVYIRKWVPDFDSSSYPKPIVDHAFARQRCLETYKKALSK